MNKPYEIIQELRSTNSRNEKIAIIKREAENNNQDFFKGLNYALNPFITFGVKKIKEADDNMVRSDYAPVSFDMFSELFERLISRELSGNDALREINNTMNNSFSDVWNDWYRLILIKDLKCGVNIKTVNTAIEQANFPSIVKISTFECQLAKDAKDHPKKITGKKIVDVKLDGVRVITILYPNGKCDQYSRNGKELHNFSHIKEQFKKFCDYIDEPMIFDGEVMSTSFQDLMTQVYRKDNINSDDAVLFLFDCLTLSEFNNGISKRNQSERKCTLSFLFDKIKKPKNIELLGYRIIDDIESDEGQNTLKELNDHALKEKYEGIMIKDYDAPYECKRSTNWLKFKPSITVDLKLIDMIEGTGKYENSLGSFLCEGYHEDKFVRVNVGSGFSDDQRKEFWLNRNRLIHQIELVEVECDAITKSKDSENEYSLRFPRFVRFRRDKDE